MKAWRSRMPAALALLVMLAGCAGPSPGRSPTPEEAPRPNIVLVVIDTLRRDHLGLYGYQRQTSPNLDEFSQQAVVYQEAFAQSPYTKTSVASLWTSRYPHQHRVLDVPDVLSAQQVTLAETLRAAGYATAGFVETIALDEKFGFSQGFDIWRMDTSRSWEGKQASTGRELDQEVQSWLKQRDVRRPFFLYVHYLDPHMPYQAPESYRLYYEGKRPVYSAKPHDTPRDPQTLTNLSACYDEEIHFVDARFGALMSSLRESGLWENTVVAFTSDHGEAFSEHHVLFHSTSVYGEQINIPFMLRAPGRLEGGRATDPVSLVDLTPTLLDLAGVSIAGQGFQGVSLARGAPGSRPVLSEQLRDRVEFPVQQALIKDGWKLIVSSSGEASGLYSLTDDPLDLSSVAEKTPEVVARMEAELRDILAKSGPSPDSEHEVLSEKETRVLKSLDYLR